MDWELGLPVADIFFFALWMHACSVMSSSLQPHGLWLIRFLCSWDFSGKNTGVGCHILLQGIFPTQGQTLLSCVSCISRQILYHLSYQECHQHVKKKGTLCLEIHELKNTNKTKSREDCFDQRKLLLLMPGLLKATCEKDLLIST